MKLSTGLLLASIVFSLSISFFIFGYQFCFDINKKIGLIMIIISFFSSISSAVIIQKIKMKINLLLDYSKPLFSASEKIKEIVKRVNIYGIENLHVILEKVMKEEIKKIISQEIKEENNE